MPSIQIPTYYRDGLGKLAQLGNPEFAQLSEALQNTSPSLNRIKLARQISSVVAEWSPEDGERVTEALLWLLAGQDHLQQPLAEFAQAVSTSPDLGIAEQETKAVLAARLTELLGISPLQLSWKALDVLTEHEKRFDAVRIMTDLRPIFGEQIEGQPQVAVIVNMLGLKYVTDRNLREIFIALDTRDLKTLRSALDRAEAKTKILEDLAESAGITYLKPED